VHFQPSVFTTAVTTGFFSRVVFNFNLQSKQKPRDTTGFSRVVLQLQPTTMLQTFSSRGSLAGAL